MRKLLSCNCLNVIVDVERFQKVSREDLDLSDEEKCDSFFKEESYNAGKLVNTMKQYGGLVDERPVGYWTVNHCLNCDILTHAIHRQKGASFVVVRMNLMDEDAIVALRNSDMYSQVFNIVVNPFDLEPTRPIEDCKTRELTKLFKGINEAVSKYVTEQQNRTEEIIKEYADEQYDKLNKIKDRAYRERAALISVIRTITDEGLQQMDTKPANPLSSDATNDSFVPKSPLTVPFSPKRSKSISTGRAVDDDLLMFEFDSEFVSQGQVVFKNESDSDSDIEEGEDAVNESKGISILKGKSDSASNSVAKSCPVDIPIFPPLARSRHPRDESGEEYDVPSSEKVDIAASIKALAKSVHGDGIFGDLPRPRFSTQI